MTDPTTPADLSPGAERLWEGVLAELTTAEQLTPAKLQLLTLAVQTATLADRLAAEIDENGLIIQTRTGPQASPLLASLDRARRLTASLLKQLSQKTRAESSAENGASRWARQPRPVPASTGDLRDPTGVAQSARDRHTSARDRLRAVPTP